MLGKWFNVKALPLYALCVLALLLAVAYGMSLRTRPVLNIPQTGALSGGIEEQTAAADVADGDFFKEFRAQRETARADELQLLDSILQREDAPPDSIREADSRKVQLTRFYEQERAIEKLLIAKGFEDAAAFIQDGSVSVIIKKEKLSVSESDKILEIALRESGQDAANIKIIPVVQ